MFWQIFVFILRMFEEKQLEQSTFILNNIIYEEKQLQKRKKQQPQLWNEPAWEKTLVCIYLWFSRIFYPACVHVQFYWVSW